MPEPFSYHMATAYQKAFKEFLTYTRLYETLLIMNNPIAHRIPLLQEKFSREEIPAAS